ncbi:TPA: hypothetical protein RTH03_001585 [Campylobacter jejuni]|nr:hypothetical protein [Campylobacter jejuni]HDZ5106093.1 hypothetical protein [Campylobacter jejuni]
MKDTINIHSIIHNLDFKDIKQKIEKITEYKEPEKLIVIAPNAFIAQRISDLLQYNDDKKEKFKFYTWENIDFNTLFDKEIEMSLEGQTQIKKKDFKITIPIQYLKNEAYSNPLVKFYKAVVNDPNTREMIAHEHFRISEALSIKRQDKITKQFACFPEDSRTVSPACNYVNKESDTLEKMLKQYQHPTFQLCFTLLLKQSNLWGKENISKEEAEKNQAFIYLNKLCDDIKNDLTLLSQKNIFAKEDKQKFEKILDDTFDEIKKNLIKVLEDGDKDKTRTLWLIGITIAAVIIGVSISIVTLGAGTLAITATLGIVAFDIVMGIIDYEEELEKIEASKFYLPFAVPLMKTLFEDISYISALCSTQLYSCMIFYDNKFLDLSAIDFSCFFEQGKDAINQNTHIIEGECDQDLKYRILQNFGIAADKPTQTKENKEKQDELGNISTLHTFNPSINDFSKNYQCALELYEEQDKDFKNFVFIEQPQFLSRGLAKLIKNDILKDNASSKQNKNYLLISQAPHNTMTNLSQSITEEIFNTNIVRPEAPKDQTQIDYSKYDLEQDKNSKEFVLQLSPFVKESATEARALKNWFKKNIDDRNNNAKLKEIASHFLSAEYKKNIENVEKKIKEKQKNLYETLLDNLTLKSFNKNHPDDQLEFLPIEQILQIGLIIASAKIQKIPVKIKSSDYPNNHNIDLKELGELFYKIATDKAFLEQLDNKLQIGDIKIDLSKNYKSVDDFILKNIIPKEELDSAYDEVNFMNLRFEILKKAFGDFISSLVPFADGFEEALAKLALIFALTSIAVIVKNKELIKNLSLPGKNFSSMSGKKELTKSFLQDFLKFSAKDLKTAIKSFHPSLALLLALKDDYKILKNNKEFIKKLSNFRIDENIIKDTINNLHSDSKKRFNANKKIKGHLFTYVELEGDKDTVKASAYTRKGVMKHLGFYHRMRFFNVLNEVKDLRRDIIVSLVSNIFKFVFGEIYKTHTQVLLAEYEDIFFLNLERHHRPYATIRNEFLSYPLALHSNFASYNFSTALFGSRLEALSLEIFPNIMLYSSAYKKVRQDFTTSAVYTIREMVVKKLLSYIVPDELRGGLDDKSFMQKFLQRHITKGDIMNQYYLDENFINTNLNLPQKEIKLALIKKFNRNGNEDDALKAYNELIKILSEVIDGNLNGKGKAILSSLKIIGKNNIKALYVGINDENKQENKFKSNKHDAKKKTGDKTSEKRPPFLGRLATTIITERPY